MTDQRYFIGDFANMSGLTIRTLQHYDNIGLLPASGRTENGRRFYIKSDILKLEQIVFYKNLGFSLQQIREKLVHTSDLQEMDKIFLNQSTVLYSQMESTHTSLAVIEACREVIEVKKNPPWEFLFSFISKLNNSDFLTWDSSDFTKEQQQIFNNHFHSIDEIISIFHTWKSLSIKAVTFYAAGIQPSESVAQNLAKQWMNMAESATGGNEQLLNAYLQVNQNREMWPEGARALMEEADSYITDYCKIYCANNDINMPW
ncbi:MerR family transcriptional regulator [Niallia sp. 01092]|uniref:MerR family transcriptional regulator n=1 Tax=unclassified Niallia TaxID=2837522 RepID=UPI003FD206B2